MKKMLLGLLVCNCMGLYAMFFRREWLVVRSQGRHSDRQTLGPLVDFPVDLPSSDSRELSFGNEFHRADRLVREHGLAMYNPITVAVFSRLHERREAQGDPVDDGMNYGVCIDYESDEEGDPRD